MLIRSVSYRIKGTLLTRNFKGINVRVIGKLPKITNRSRISIGKGVTFQNVTQRTRLSASNSGSIFIGKSTFINQGCNFHSDSSIWIGENVKIGENVTIFDTSFHSKYGNDKIKSKPVVIESDVWIANNVSILLGVTIGKGSVIGIGSIVLKSFPPNSFVVGNPGYLKETFSPPDENNPEGI